ELARRCSVDPGRRELAERAHAAFARIVAPGEWDDAHRDAGRAAATLRELGARALLAVPQPNGEPARAPQLDVVYAPLVELACCAPDELLDAEIRDRNLFATLAAGLRADRDLYDVCETLLRTSLRAPVFRQAEAQRTCATTFDVLRLIDADRLERS